MAKVMPELLAPAGGYEAGCAAFTYGADAIYCGLPQFSARADAQNVSVEELEKLIAYGRSFDRPRKVYVTMNTLLQTAERKALLDSLSVLDDLAVDGVIIQDLGLADLMRRNFPKIPRHASTQLACMSTDAAFALKDLGFSRIVTGRELSLEEAATISRHTGLEVEVFIHGALCYGVSGLCLFSALDMGRERSGNRGKCAYCCRRAFEPCDEQGDALRTTEKCHPFSMRDLNGVNLVDHMKKLGLASLKIEGRMKSPLYVAAVTDFYRGLLDGAYSPAEIDTKAQDLQTIFSRPWTNLYMLNKQAKPESIIDALCVGHRGAQIGKVDRIIHDRDGSHWLRFESQRALEKHDGVQVDPPDGGRPIGFAVDRIRLRGERSTQITTPTKCWVEIELPPDVRPIQVGAHVYCSASQAVRRAFPIPTPRSTLCRILRPIEVTVTLQAPECEAQADGCIVRTPCTLTPAKNPDGTPSAVRKTFERMGDEGFVLSQLTVVDPNHYYAPPSVLNALRRQLTTALNEQHEAHVAKQLANVQRLLNERPTQEEPIPHLSPVHQAVWHMKVRPDLPLSLLRDDWPDELILALQRETVWTDLELWFSCPSTTVLRFALPLMTLDGSTHELEGVLRRLLEQGVQRFEVPDLSALYLLKRITPSIDDLDITADWSWYALNPDAVNVQVDAGVTGSVTAPEDTWENILSLPSPTGFQRQVLVSAYLPYYVSFTRPETPSALLRSAKGDYLCIHKQNHLYVTSGTQAQSFVPSATKRLAAGINHWRIDWSWAAPRVIKQLADTGTHWRLAVEESDAH